MNSKYEIEIIGYDCGWGCRDYGCEDGPEHILKYELEDGLKQLGHKVVWHPKLYIKDMGSRQHIENKEQTLPLVIEASKRLASAVESAIEKNRIPVVIGGDHTAAIGTWSATTSAFGCFREFGLIWIDAHMDAHTPDTAHQGKWGGWWHGMPVACLAGEGLKELTSIASNNVKINMEHFSLLGARSYEQGEEEFMQNHQANIYKMSKIKEMGFKNSFEQALKTATTGTKAFGVSIDLDGFSPNDAPAVGTAEKDGISANDALFAFTGLAKSPLFKAIEIVEYNPHQDIDNKTAKLINKIILAIFN